MCHNIKTWIWAAAAGPKTADIGTDDTFVFKILAEIAHSCTQLYTYNIQYVQTAVDMLRNGGQGGGQGAMGQLAACQSNEYN